MPMTIQNVALSTDQAQAASGSSGASKSQPSAADAAFLSLMRTASRQTQPQGKAAEPGHPSGDGKTEDDLPRTDGDAAGINPAALPYDASALAALLAVQSSQANPGAALLAAGTAQNQTAPAQSAPVQSAALPSIAAQPESTNPAAMQGAALFRQTVPAQQQSPAGSAEVPARIDGRQSAQASSATAQTLPQTARQTPVSVSESPADGGAVSPGISPQGETQSGQTFRTAQGQQSGITALEGTQVSPPAAQPGTSDKIVVLSSAGTTDTAGVQATEPGATEQSFSDSTGSSGGKDSASAPGRQGTAAPSIAALYSDGKVVVKVSDVSDKTGQMRASPAGQIANAVSAGLKTGVKQLKVDLYPESLGKVSVELTSKNGLLTVQLAADNAKTRDLIASSSGDIRSMLQNATGQSVQVVRPDPAAAQQQWYAPNDGYGGQDGRQQQESGRQKKNSEDSYSLSDIGAVSTEDFLSIMQRTAGAQRTAVGR